MDETSVEDLNEAQKNCFNGINDKMMCLKTSRQFQTLYLTQRLVFDIVGKNPWKTHWEIKCWRKSNQSWWNKKSTSRNPAQFKHSLNINRDKTLAKLCKMLAEPSAYEAIVPSFCYPSISSSNSSYNFLCFVKGDFLYKTEFVVC